MKRSLIGVVVLLLLGSGCAFRKATYEMDLRHDYQLLKREGKLPMGARL